MRRRREDRGARPRVRVRARACVRARVRVRARARVRARIRTCAHPGSRRRVSDKACNLLKIPSGEKLPSAQPD